MIKYSDSDNNYDNVYYNNNSDNDRGRILSPKCVHICWAIEFVISIM